MDLSKGSFTLVNNVVALNGTKGASGSDLGGIKLSSATKVTFYNNTVADNEAKTGKAGGVICDSSADTLINSILWGNGTTQYLACTINHSDVQGGATGGTGNINKDPLFDAAYKPKTTPTVSPCIDAGDKTGLSAVTVLDRLGNGRIKGTQVDMGAYEVK